MKSLFNRSENLHKQEENFSRDADTIPESVALQMVACKESVATALLQISVMYNDVWFVTTCKSINEKIPRKAIKGPTDVKINYSVGKLKAANLLPIQQNRKMFNYFSFIMFNYLFYNVTFEGNV